MTRLRKRRLAVVALGLLLLATAALVVLLARADSRAWPARDADRPDLLLLTTLPIVFPEEISLEGGGSPALSALESRYRVRPISTAEAANLRDGAVLLMAQPQAQTAEALVNLDSWVRGGGRVLLLADPALQWRSELPLGDVRRPPYAFADTGLLGHWGLRLDAPERIGPAAMKVDGTTVLTRSAGELVALDDQCAVANGTIARCAIGHGKATVIPDADFLDSGDNDRRQDSANLGLLLAELKRLER